MVAMVGMLAEVAAEVAALLSSSLAFTHTRLLQEGPALAAFFTGQRWLQRFRADWVHGEMQGRVAAPFGRRLG